jgi:hypothetical protein
VTALLLSYTLIVAAQVISYGRLEAHALLLVILGLAAGISAVFSRQVASRTAGISRVTMIICVAAPLLLAAIHNPLTYCGSDLWLTCLRSGILIALLLLLTYAFATPSKITWVTSIRFGLLLLLGIAARMAVPLFSPTPGEDVWVVQQEAAQAVLNGQNPYAVAYSQIFSPDVYSLFGYRSGFHYPPLTALPIAASLALTGDIRWAYIVCELLILRLLWRIMKQTDPGMDRPSRELMLWLWAFNPSVLFILEHSWTEPLGLLFILLFAWWMLRRKRWLAAASLALFLSFKQYTLLLCPLLFFLPGCGPAVLCFVAITVASYLPFWLIDRASLVGSLLEPWRAKPRADGLSLAALWMRYHGTPLAAWVSPLASLGGMILSWIRMARTPRGLIGAVFVILAILFVTAKQSFANYYYLLSFLGLLLLVLPADAPDGEHPT